MAPKAKEIYETLNDHNPLRLAFIGGAKSGKSSIISKVSINTFQDTYYPTHAVLPLLLDFVAQNALSRTILDDHHHQNSLNTIVNCKDILPSPILSYSYTSPSKPTQSQEKAGVVIHSKNEYYTLYNYSDEYSAQEYVPPHISPILMELIDTPLFDPKNVVPFLEASLHAKLDKREIHNLADEPRIPVSTNPLLVASGASALNGNVDGYFLVYSAIPLYNPPSYNESPSDSIADDSFSLLSIIKNGLDEAWEEYMNFKRKYHQYKESDIFSIKNALRNIWKDEEKPGDVNVNNDTSDDDDFPSLWIVCTHANSSLKSPMLIQKGAELAKEWRCGFVAIDNKDEGVDHVIGLMVKEILVRKSLQKRK